MSRNGVKYILSFALSLLGMGAGAQSLPSLKTADEIQVFKLPNSVTCYVAVNKTRAGVADFALVQEGPDSLRAGRGSLESLIHFPARSPELFLRANSILYSAGSYPEGEDGTTIFRFSGVSTETPSVMDTTMLIVFDLVAQCPYSQAVIISGDVNVASVRDRLNVFSMIVSPRVDRPAGRTYTFKERARPEPAVIRSSQTSAVIGVEYHAARTPAKLMPTVQPAMTRMFFSEIGYILERRLRMAFRDASVPLADVRCFHLESACTSGDESFRISVVTAAGHEGDASTVMAAVLSGLGSYGVSVEEMKEARDWYLGAGKVRTALMADTNEDYIRRCASAFLFGSSLAPVKSELDYFAARPIGAEKECEIINSFISALLGKAVSDDGEASGFVPARGDTLAFPEWSARRKDVLKITSEAKEPVTGGSLWTFSNGMRVIYKKMATPGVFEYSLMLRGGCADIPDLGWGEIAYVPEMLKLSRIAGMSPERVAEMLKANSIVLEPTVSLSDMRISGAAPKAALPLLMKVLLAMAGDREPDAEAFSAYRDAQRILSEAIAGSRNALDAKMDSLLRPDYRYLSFKDPGCLGDDLPERAGRYFTSQFSKVNDGVLVLFGDLDEQTVRKTLCRCLAGFRTSRSYSVRPQVGYVQRSGCSTYTESPASAGGRFRDEGIFVGMSCITPLTAGNYMALKMCTLAMENDLNRLLCNTGYRVDVTSGCEFFPMERMTATVSAVPGRGAAEEPLSVVQSVRRALADVSSRGITDGELKTLKSVLTKEMDYNMGRPEFLLQMALLRYSEGKDLLTDYKNRINAVKKEEVNSVLKALDGGGKIEYIISR